MSKEYIEREAAEKVAAKYGCTNGATIGIHSGIADCIAFEIAKLPAADVSPVVRCKECKHWKPSGSKAGNSFSDMEYIGGCEFTNYCRRESDFCSYGERKEGAE